MKKIYIVLLVFLLPLIGMSQNENGAFGGGNGIFVFLNDDLYSSSKPYKGAVKIKIERQAENSQWEDVGVVSSPDSEKEFESRLKAAQKEMPYKVDVLEGRASEIWTALGNWSNKSDTSNSLIYLAVQMAAGWVYLDKEAKPETKYIYRITYLSEKEESLKELSFEPTYYPKVLEISNFNYQSNKSDGNGLTLEWIGERGNLPSVVQAFRREKLSDTYEKIDAKFALQTTNQGNKVIFLDRSVENNHLYQYKLFPMDQFGNTGVGKESPVIGHYNFTVNAPVITNFKAVHTENTLGTTLLWQYQNYELVAAVEVYRSKDYDGKYELLTTLPRNANSYRDQTVDPMDKYYYHLQVVGPLGEIGPASIRLFSIFEDQQLSAPPNISLDKVTGESIQLKIELNDIHCEGIRVFRSLALDGNWEVVSDLLKVAHETTLWTDKMLSDESRTYYYTAEAVNTSHVSSEKADVVNVYWSGKKKAKQINAPRNLSFSDNKSSIMLYWEAMLEENISYIVMRKKLGELQYKSLNKTAIGRNNFLDENVELTASYEYKVLAVFSNGSTSKMTNPIVVNRKSIAPKSPSDVKVLSTKEGLRITWNSTDHDNLRSYQIFRYERNTSPIKVATIQADELNEFVDKNVVKNELYFYHVVTVSKDGTTSKPSMEVGARKK